MGKEFHLIASELVFMFRPGVKVVLVAASGRAFLCLRFKLVDCKWL